MGSRRRGRILAMQALYSWDVAGQAADQLSTFPWLDRASDDDDTLAFARLLVVGTIEQIEPVDRSIGDHLANWDIKRVARVDLAILRLSTYCLLFQPSIPASVTIDEAIDIAKDYSGDEAYRFVNGVLDGIRKDCGK